MDNPREQANAALFIQALKVDAAMKKAWLKLMARIANIKQTGQHYQQELVAVNNFLADNGFDCSAKTVLGLIKAPFFIQHQKEISANEESDRFVKTVLGNFKLYKEWQATLQKAKDNSRLANDFLSQRGYACNIEQVDSSFRNMRNHALIYWAGTYATTIGQGKKGPLIIISDRGLVSIDQDRVDERLNHMRFRNGVLTWKADDLRLKFSGSLQLSEVIVQKEKDHYVGNEIFGSIIYPERDSFYPYQGKISVAGRVSHIFGEDIVDKVPAAISIPKMNKVIQYLGYFLASIFVVKMIASIPQQISHSLKKFSKNEGKGKFNENFERNEQEMVSGEREMEEMSDAPLESRQLVESDLLDNIREKIDRSFSDTEIEDLKGEFDAELNIESDFNASIEKEAAGEGWAEDLSAVVEDVL